MYMCVCAMSVAGCAACSPLAAEVLFLALGQGLARGARQDGCVVLGGVLELTCLWQHTSHHNMGDCTDATPHISPTAQNWHNIGIAESMLLHCCSMDSSA